MAPIDFKSTKFDSSFPFLKLEQIKTFELFFYFKDLFGLQRKKNDRYKKTFS